VCSLPFPSNDGTKKRSEVVCCSRCCWIRHKTCHSKKSHLYFPDSIHLTKYGIVLNETIFFEISSPNTKTRLSSKVPVHRSEGQTKMKGSKLDWFFLFHDMIHFHSSFIPIYTTLP
jgi:hypothetical protein